MKKFLKNLFCKQTNAKLDAICTRTNENIQAACKVINTQLDAASIQINEHINASCMHINKKLDILETRINFLTIQNKILLEALSENFYNDKNILTKRFFKAMPRAVAPLSNLQDALFYMLLNFKKICDENNISYWLQAGTLLGAYRHNAWIPWDDDLDTGMLEEDLRKLKHVLQNHPVFKIEDFYHFCEGYIGKFTRIKFKDTKYNCFLDIPVYQYYDADNIDKAWEEILQIRAEFEEKAKNLSKQLKKVYHNEVVADEYDLKLIEEFFDNEISRLHKTDGKFIYWASYSVPAHWKRIFPKEMFFPLNKLPFESEYFSVPNKYEDYLKLQYEDILALPQNACANHVEHFDLFNNIEQLSDYIKVLKEMSDE